METRQPSIIVVDDDDDDISSGSDTDFEFPDIESDDSNPEIIVIDDDDDDYDSRSDSQTPTQRDFSIRLPDIEESRYTVNGVLIKPGFTVELKDQEGRPKGQLHSGDFLRVKHIIRNLETDEVRLRGLRLQRTKYQRQLFDWKLNELAMVLHVDEHDDQSPFLQGMVDKSTADVLRVRDCIFTSSPYPLLSFRDPTISVSSRMRNNEDTKRWLFHHGHLTCRVVNILHLHTNGKAYSGVVRQLYPSEADSYATSSTASTPPQGVSRENSITLVDTDEDDVVIISQRNSSDEHLRRSFSIASLDHPSRKRPVCPTTRVRYTFGDCFCGAGGASQGAVQAGLVVTWGLDNNDIALEAYGQNHCGAIPFCANAHDFPPPGATKQVLNVDILHLSPPCCYWSPAHTRRGRNDQANFESIYTVGPILTKCGPRIATMEQTYGLSTHDDHKPNFLLLLYDIGKAGYDVRYKIVNMARYGLSQLRKRLLIIAARRGQPLPPFPRPTHGPLSSGLKRFVSVADTLRPLERLGQRAFTDRHHQPEDMRRIDAQPYDPHVSLLGACVTTSGGENHHYSGKRGYTPREFALFQSFNTRYRFTGSKTDAMKQIGNAFPPVMAEAMFRNIAKTLEAFDHGIIGAGEIIDDLDTVLEEKGVERKSGYRYLFHGDPPPPKQRVSSAIFSKRVEIEPLRPSLMNGRPRSLPLRLSRRQRQVLMDAELAEENGDIIMLD